ncbi:MAG TPA: YggS family pyridoxal phosphate-dependent enzyme [Actinomycetota bacterium]|nr:YggS family pyridoxal phosphate-dependent enzyme [Actinomycetota bacterium]
MAADEASIRARIASVVDRMAGAENAAGRPAGSVRLVAVSKSFTVDVVRAAMACGLTLFGENRAQELKEKALVLGAAPDGPTWHFIGQLQTNKVRDVVGRAELIHSVDRFGVAEAIAVRAQRAGAVAEVLVQVNVGREASKGGIEPERAVAFAAEIDTLEGLRVRGLMTIPPGGGGPDAARPYFAELAGLGSRLTAVLPDATELSMGMSDDLEVAIAEGATLVRVGRALFGNRGGPGG